MLRMHFSPRWANSVWQFSANAENEKLPSASKPKGGPRARPSGNQQRAVAYARLVLGASALWHSNFAIESRGGVGLVSTDFSWKRAGLL